MKTAAILVILILVILYVVFRNPKKLFQIGIRLCIGLVLIHGINVVLAQMGVGILVGINWLSGVTVAFLGVPGILLLYMIQIFIQ